MLRLNALVVGDGVVVLYEWNLLGDVELIDLESLSTSFGLVTNNMTEKLLWFSVQGRSRSATD